MAAAACCQQSYLLPQSSFSAEWQGSDSGIDACEQSFWRNTKMFSFLSISEARLSQPTSRELVRAPSSNRRLAQAIARFHVANEARMASNSVCPGVSGLPSAFAFQTMVVPSVQ